MPKDIQNVENTSIVVMILDKETGEILTAEVVHADNYSGVESVVASADYVAAQQGNALVVKAEEGAKVDVYSAEGLCLGTYEMTNNVLTVENPNFNGMMLVRITKGNETKVVKFVWK